MGAGAGPRSGVRGHNSVYLWTPRSQRPIRTRAKRWDPVWVCPAGLLRFGHNRGVEAADWRGQRQGIACPGSAWWSRPGSNRRPPECHSGTLPTELRPHAGSAGYRAAWGLVKGHFSRASAPENRSVVRYARTPRRSGETGIRRGLKIPRSQGRAGSNPASGTIRFDREYIRGSSRGSGMGVLPGSREASKMDKESGDE